MIWPPWQRRHPPLVLASASSARRNLLEAVGLSFEVAPANIDESAIKRLARQDGLAASELASNLAEAKARDVAMSRPGALVIGADQVLSVGDHWFDKPVSLDEARQQLGRLQGEQQVLQMSTALVQDDRVIWRDRATPVLQMRRSSDALLDLYVEHEGAALLSCVGACRIEGPGQLLFETISGEQSAILGLPVLSLLAELRRLDVLMS